MEDIRSGESGDSVTRRVGQVLKLETEAVTTLPLRMLLVHVLETATKCIPATSVHAQVRQVEAETLAIHVQIF